MDPLEPMAADELAEIDGHEVLDPDGASVGYVDLVFADETTGVPEWLGVWNGVPYTHRHLLPIRGAVRDGTVVRTPFAKDLVHRAPSYHERFHSHPKDVHVTREQEGEAYALYGIEPLTPAPGVAYVSRFRATVRSA